MAFYRTANQLKARIARLFAKPVHGGQVINAPQVAAIDDGADYSLPVLLPEDVRQRMSAEQLRAFLGESVKDTYRFQFDTPYRTGDDLPITPNTEDPLLEWTWQTRKQVLSNCHSVYHRNPLANTAIQYTADFIIGEGFNLTAKNKQVEAHLYHFIDNPDNALREYERQAIIDLQVDGELFLRYYVGDDHENAGQVVVVPLRPWECLYVETEKGFFRRPVKYKFQIYKTPGDSWSAGGKTDIEDIDADCIQHVAINRHGYELRGRPELYRVLPWLRADKEFLENRARQNHWRNALLWFVQVANANATQLASVLARWSRPPTPGSVAVETNNVNVQPLNNSVGASDAGEDGRQIKLRSIFGLRLPEYFFADGYNANLASARSQQLPALTKFGAFQTVMLEQVWYPMFKRVLQEAVTAGVLPEYVEEQDSDGDTVTVTEVEFLHAMATREPGVEQEFQYGERDENGQYPRYIRTEKAFDVTYAPLGDNNLLTIAQAFDIITARGWGSVETAQTKVGLDPTIENKRMKREEEQRREDERAGLMAMPPGAMGKPLPGIDPMKIGIQPGRDIEQDGLPGSEKPKQTPKMKPVPDDVDSQKRPNKPPSERPPVGQPGKTGYAPPQEDRERGDGDNETTTS